MAVKRKSVSSALTLAGIVGLGVFRPSPSSGYLAAPSQEATQDRVRMILAHDNTAFPLQGRHKTVECGACHLKGVLGGTPTQCEVCHWARHPDDPFKLQLGTQCADCHTPQNWARILPGSFEHERVTGFRLEGRHQGLDCVDCHESRSFQSATATCSQCHMKDFQAAKAPDHRAASFPTDCELCHRGASTWQGAKFDHSFFPLAGQHRTATCESCHQNGRFAGTSTQCFDCHRLDFESAKNPNHVQAGFDTDCTLCHGSTAVGWSGAQFDHDRAFPLRGMHKSLVCDQCHKNGVYIGTPSECIDCHRQDYDRTTNPNHQRAGFSENCVSCHGSSATSWQTGDFDHDRLFPLKGAHRAAECTECHANGVFTGTPSQCIDCHRADYDRTTNPNHRQAGFSENCIGCHGDGAAGWSGAGFDHERVFPLRGRHRVADCSQCHVNGRFAGTPSQCIDCHRTDYDRTRNPNHASSGFGTDCSACHGDGATSWAGATFDHERFFPLRGQHRAAECTRCHLNGRFAGTPTDCVACHRTDYDRTTAPNHASAGFGTDCASCHGSQASSWLGAQFDHNRFFELRGRHLAADCTQCHPNGRFAGTPSACVDCHKVDYDRTTSPNHAQAGFGTDCASCHGNQATSWLGATFDHNQFFPLQGAHRTLDCQACHASGFNLPKDCFGCHAPDYTAARNPDHVRAGFPTSCERCHFPNHTSWSQAVFQHSFPITSGPHGKFDCAECHRTANMQEFSCTHCHNHEQRKMDEKHKDVGGYVYNSQACYSCHPNGRK
jgi:hypothetical protein